MPTANHNRKSPCMRHRLGEKLNLYYSVGYVADENFACILHYATAALAVPTSTTVSGQYRTGITCR